MIKGLKEFNETLNLVRYEVINTFEYKDMKLYPTFKDFFKEVDVYNAYETEWNTKLYKPYYEFVYNEYKKKQLKW